MQQEQQQQQQRQQQQHVHDELDLPPHGSQLGEDLEDDHENSIEGQHDSQTRHEEAIDEEVEQEDQRAQRGRGPLQRQDGNEDQVRRRKRQRPARKGAICELPGCSKRASFGDDMKKYRWCAQHRLPGSHSFQSHFCEEPACSKHASYTVDGAKKRWCASHKPPGAFIKGASLCEVHSCSKQATFGHPGKRRQWCSQHKEDGAVNLSKRTCSVLSCNNRAALVHASTRRKFCTTHAPEDCRELKARGQKNIVELQEQLAYVESENNLLRSRLKRLRAVCDPEVLRHFDRRERRCVNRPLAAPDYNDASHMSVAETTPGAVAMSNASSTLNASLGAAVAQGAATAAVSVATTAAPQGPADEGGIHANPLPDTANLDDTNEAQHSTSASLDEQESKHERRLSFDEHRQPQQVTHSQSNPLSFDDNFYA